MVKLTIEYIMKTTHKPKVPVKKSEDALKKITHLSLPEKCIDSIGDISSLTNLTVLYLHHNNLHSIDNLYKNDCITHLYLHHNNISKMEHLNDLPNLKKLYLGHNSIRVIEGLDSITFLEELHVECQHLPPGETIYFDPRTINNIATSLHTLDISENNISSLNDLKELKSIEKLAASNNLLSDLPSVCEIISYWSRIKELDFRGNVISRQNKYKDKIIAYTNSLRSLDSKDINDVTRSFIRRFELVKEERREKGLRAKEKMSYSEDISSIAEHLPPGLRQSVSESVKKEAVPRAKSLTLSLMQVPAHSPDTAMASGSLQARPSRRVSYAENAARSRVKAERENQPYIGDCLPLAVPP